MFAPNKRPFMWYDVDEHVKAFLSEDMDNKKGYYHNASREQAISCQLLSPTSFSDITEEERVHPSLDQIRSPGLPQQDPGRLEKIFWQLPTFLQVQPRTQIYTSTLQPQLKQAIP